MLNPAEIKIKTNKQNHTTIKNVMKKCGSLILMRLSVKLINASKLFLVVYIIPCLLCDYFKPSLLASPLTTCYYC